MLRGMGATTELSSALSEVLVCPNCHGRLICGKTNLTALDEGAVLSCEDCDSVFGVGEHGFLEMMVDRQLYQTHATTGEYASSQETSGIRVYEEFLKPFLLREPYRRVLDVGCGIGQEVSMLLEDGYDAYGIDLPNLTRFWAQRGNDPRHFVCASAGKLPFPARFFDLVYSLGVIEHIGTQTGDCTLSDNYQEARQAYADEIRRVTKPGGWILIACPNKCFPIDIQHGPGDALTSPNRIRGWMFRKTGMNVHSVWGESHLLSHSEVRMLFCPSDEVSSFESLSLKGLFGFGRFRKGFLKSLAGLAMLYIEHLPSVVWSSPLNPYLLVAIRKSERTS
jgi:SAM-dependent methyltransferase